ncbi:MAG: hypothetical protein P4L10_04150 [Acidobacteriaceae bacterium]|nr:hypothetical protein [Acidobacteriaceae bacterium]
MSFRRHFAGVVLLAFMASCVPAHAIGMPHIHMPGLKKKEKDMTMPGHKPNAEQNALIDKAIGREKETIKTIRERRPLVEVYLQTMKPDVALQQVPSTDYHILQRVNFTKIVGEEDYDIKTEAKKGIIKGTLSKMMNIQSVFKYHFNGVGFTRMIVMDSSKFDRQHYDFLFVRRDFLGSVRVSVFDVTPKKNIKKGGFWGRIYIEEQGGNVVRFNGTQNGDTVDAHNMHFDSWRTNVQPNLWLPTSFYVEETQATDKEHSVATKAIGHVWGYVLKVQPSDAESTSVQVENAQDVSQDAQDVSPLGAQRAWVQQAEDNVIERLFEAGLLDAPSDFDKTCADIANNIVIENKIDTSAPLKCRILLTEPLESLAIGNTILLSKGLVDTLAVQTTDPAAPLANLATFISFEVAHVILGHRLDTKYAFNDRLLFPDEAAFQRIPMHHTDTDNEAAAKKALDLLNGSEFKDKLNYPGLYLQQLATRVKQLPHLNEAIIGDALIKNEKDYSFWMGALVSKGGKLDMKDLTQNAAMPLSSFLKFDPWTDQVNQIHARYEPLLSERDKMPFEVTPVYMKLSYFVGPVTAPAAAPGAAAPADQTAPAGATATPAGTTAAPADQTAPATAPAGNVPAAPAPAAGATPPGL